MRNSKKFLAGLSHEMRSYLNAIVGFSYIIEGNRKTIDSGLSGKILSTCNQLIWLMDNFLNSEMMEIEESEMRLTKCNLRVFSSQINKELNDILRQVAAKEIILDTDEICHEEEEMLMDGQKLTHIIKALFINSVNSMDKGNIRLGYYYDGFELKLKISDSSQEYEKCNEFLNSHNLDHSLSKFYDAGSAINIILSKKLIALMDGTIQIRPNKTEGIVYTISIPDKSHFSNISTKKYKTGKGVSDTCTITNIH